MIFPNEAPELHFKKYKKSEIEFRMQTYDIKGKCENIVSSWFDFILIAMCDFET